MLRIAFDLDGTLADMEPALEQIATRLFPDWDAARRGQAEPSAAAPSNLAATRPVLPDDAAAPASPPAHEPAATVADLTPEEEQLEPPSVRRLTRRQQAMIWDEVRHTENFWEFLPEIEPAIVSRIAAIAEERRWEVIFITTRPASAGDTTQRQSQRWLAAHGFPLPSVFVASGSRGKIAAALSLDVFVDDRPENCLDVKVDSQARAVLVLRDANAQTAANATRLGIDVLPTVGALLDELTAPPPPKPSLLDRLKDAMGVRR